jgi:AAA ATPase domain
MRTRAPALVGRATEIEEIERALQDAGRSSGSAVFVTGEPGIGKTRLAAEAVGRALDAGLVVLRGRGSTTGPAVPFRALTEALLSLARTGGHELVERLGPYRSVLGRLIPDWARPPRAVSLYLTFMSAPVSRMVLMTLSSET